MEIDTKGIPIDGFKPYIQIFKKINIGFKIKKLFSVDIEKIKDWYKNLEKNYNDWKFVYGIHKDIMWKLDPGDSTGLTGHRFMPDTAWYNLCFNGDKIGPIPPEQVIAHPEYQDEDLDELYPRKCFDGYPLELVKNLPVRTKRWLVTIHTPGTKLITHQDSPDKIRIHIPIYTNKDSNWIVDGEEFHMEPGWAYIVNTSLPHSVENKGNTDRIHLYGKIWTTDVLKGLI